MFAKEGGTSGRTHWGAPGHMLQLPEARSLIRPHDQHTTKRSVVVVGGGGRAGGGSSDSKVLPRAEGPAGSQFAKRESKLVVSEARLQTTGTNA